MNVLVIDSGYGGLPVLNALSKRNPNNQYIYIADTGNFPYGNKSVEELTKIIQRIEDNIKDVDQIYFACNTLSAIFYDSEKYTGVIKPVIEYVNNKGYKNIVVFATNNTVKSRKFESLIESSVNAYEQQELINIIENKGDYTLLLEESLKLITEEVDCLILGCTHFLLIKDEFKKRLNIDVVCVDELI